MSFYETSPFVYIVIFKYLRLLIKLRLSSLLCITMLIMSCKTQHVASKPAVPNDLSGVEKALGWTSLFDGVSMDQWRLYNGKGMSGWAVRDGVMVALGIEGKSADAITIDTFRNFELRLEWMISKGGNSGIFFNVREGEGLTGVYQSGPEYQLIDDEGFAYPLESWQLTAANYAMHPPKIKAYNPQGTYNTSRIIVDHGLVQHWLNDRLIVRYELWSEEWQRLKDEGKWKDYPSYGIYPSGHIALQDHGNEVSFRNIKIRKL